MKRFRPTLSQYKELSNKLHEMNVKYQDALYYLSHANTDKMDNYSWAVKATNELTECQAMRDLYFRCTMYMTLGLLAIAYTMTYVLSVS